MYSLSNLFEQNLLGRQDLMIVDVQPAYESYIKFNISDFVQWLNSTNYNQIYFLFNGEAQGYADNWDAVKTWYKEHGLKNKILVKTKDLEKEYGFFRDLMDEAYEDDEIIPLVQYLIKHPEFNNAQQLDFDDLFDLTQNSELAKEISRGGLDLWIPPIADTFQKITNPIELVGGSKKQCLAEIALLLKVLNKPFTINKNWIY